MTLVDIWSHSRANCSFLPLVISTTSKLPANGFLDVTFRTFSVRQSRFSLWHHQRLVLLMLGLHLALSIYILEEDHILFPLPDIPISSRKDIGTLIFSSTPVTALKNWNRMMGLPPNSSSRQWRRSSLLCSYKFFKLVLLL